MDLQSNFLNRLQALQRLCSGSDDSSPVGLLFVPGPDGRNNRGSLTVLKYLFEGSVGKELFEGLLDDSLECLEEIVLLIQETSVSVIYTHEMKKKLTPWFSSCPLLIEYLSSQREEGEVGINHLLIILSLLLLFNIKFYLTHTRKHENSALSSSLFNFPPKTLSYESSPTYRST